MITKPMSTPQNNYHEDQMLFILMSHRFQVDRIQKIIANPIFEAPKNIHKVSVELSAILRQLKGLGWYIPQNS